MHLWTIKQYERKAKMSLNWLRSKKKAHKVVTIEAIAARYNVHRHTAGRWLKGVDLCDFFAVYERLKAIDQGK